jgi:hypothetical protein
MCRPQTVTGPVAAPDRGQPAPGSWATGIRRGTGVPPTFWGTTSAAHPVAAAVDPAVSVAPVPPGGLTALMSRRWNAGTDWCSRGRSVDQAEATVGAVVEAALSTVVVFRPRASVADQDAAKTSWWSVVKVRNAPSTRRHLRVCRACPPLDDPLTTSIGS